jgi:hypothetical protein
MDTTSLHLSPSQAAVLDIYRRLDRVGLGSTATYDVVAVHGQINKSMAAKVAGELEELGLLACGESTGGRTKRSKVLTEAGRSYSPPAMPQAG